MKIVFQLAWLDSKKIKNPFKQESYSTLFNEYKSRITNFLACEIRPGLPQRVKSESSTACIWVCEREKNAKILSSEQLAQQLGKVLLSGVSELKIIIGPPNGFTEEELSTFKPTLRWSFGTLTLPHELASVVAAEQIYRAFCILKNHPYHASH